MGWISEVFVHTAIDAAINSGAVPDTARDALFRQVGVVMSAPLDPSRMIADRAFFDLLEQLAQGGEAGRLVPIAIGSEMRCDAYGAFGLAFKSAPDLLGSYRRVERFGRVVTSIANFRVVSTQDTVLLQVIPDGVPRLGLAMTHELAVAAAMALSREVSAAPFRARSVHFMREAPENVSVYAAHFRCPLRFGADWDGIEVDAEVAARPNRLSDDGVSSFFDTYLEEALAQPRALSGLERDVLEHIGDALATGVPTLAEIARPLGMSPRSLQRRLSEEGLVFRDLISRARKTLAEQLLRQGEFGLAEIAFLTGFSDQSAFTRAFRRWNGLTPARFRKER
jgi:AraC-like DNA-binding protein